MKFRITTVDLVKPEEIIEKYPCLKDFGFEACNVSNGHGSTLYAFVTIDSVEDLLKLIDALDEPVIVRACKDQPFEIEIYDDYRE